jgi:cell division protein FtsX
MRRRHKVLTLLLTALIAILLGLVAIFAFVNLAVTSSADAVKKANSTSTGAPESYGTR